MRFDLKVIASWIEPGSRVLDLGCGGGDLLYLLKQDKKICGTGIELEEAKVSACIERGLTVLQGDINDEIKDYPDQAFDYVILSQTLQQVYDPRWLIKEMLRVGKTAIVSFPNFSHYGLRLELLLTGKAPVSEELPYQWYDTPNIRVITLKDFRLFIKQMGLKILKEVSINTDHHQEGGNLVRFAANLRATYGIFLLGTKYL